MKTQHPALKQAPKSLREALQRALDYAKRKKLAACNYQTPNGCCCIIGQFFTPAQRRWLLQNKDHNGDPLNEASVHRLARIIGSQNIMSMTGMNMEQADALQRFNDFTTDRNDLAMVRWLENVLKTGRGGLFGTRFIL